MEYFELLGKLEHINLIRRIFLQEVNSKFEIYQGQMPLLGYVLFHPGCTQVEIAQELAVTPASVATSSKRLAKAGLLVKNIDEDNLRCKKVFLTKKGEQIARECGGKLYEFDKRMFDGFSEEDMKTLSVFFDRIQENTLQALKEQSDISMESNRVTVPYLLRLMEKREKELKRKKSKGSEEE
ncbi:DNA-binding transcriptional regulator, MarR family [Acetitomaculum ruminis DSM 5522]|uniref:DNA-binding transcriptional regulator, MarR family n=1 Tax=Acetitomaculum ruminis DSM 5522 TaxID=1120918 RepID=A0A1I0WZQ0_9FIRM|nr:MarR family winged helix-turn-helix transcriptional regulator [Acetitomaculum ruminis]SFA94209.1 DNA-binding transcriptional regulator, MarR family [Acetitomaculum ruminis DSM 5522]